MGRDADGARVLRLRYWNRLFRGLAVSIRELDRSFDDLIRESDCDERRAFILLRACAGLFNSSRWAIRHALRIAILYWFANVDVGGTRRRRVPAKSSSFDLSDALGTGLTWDEAVASMGRRPIDFSAYLWMLELLEATYHRHWIEVFGQAPTGDRETMGAEGAEGHVPLV